MIKIMFLSNNQHAKLGLFDYYIFLDFSNKQEYLTT